MQPTASSQCASSSSPSKPLFKTYKKILNAGRGGQLPEFRTGTKAIFHYEALRPIGGIDPDLEGFPQSRCDL
ncbi:unnamed protein product [Anisakis simplex]|uniref:Peptidylprolyl isomerase n=1 Tax=Anisakis simplex TaxID=6269 RepID=A0A0M3KG70_ANISI|nr:unnamed protein product [Anisakis simplex]